MKSLNANVVLRSLLGDIPEQSRKADEVITGSQCYISDVIFTEVVFALEKLMEVSRSDIFKIMTKFLAFPNVRSNEKVLNGALELYAQSRKLSFADCYAAVEAENSGAVLLTFDKDLIKFGGEYVLEP
ncbi:hypothetical protein BH24ACI3_BH24ACI3_08370 [soil metagenome]